ncbi:hypothetical protein [Pseudomonas nitroreducens]|uniref:hypothetical protein n=1 Tax=Pseudomonas nitroreducens TaxID=46680 RepID=UPI00126A5F33|nr:hypothetical protein [Pseudomonas nitroreducens]
MSIRCGAGGPKPWKADTPALESALVPDRRRQLPDCDPVHRGLAGLGWILFSGGLDMTVVKERRYLLLGSGGLMLVVSAYILLMSIPTSFLSTIRRDGS